MDNKLIVILLLVAGFFVYMQYANSPESLDNVPSETSVPLMPSANPVDVTIEPSATVETAAPAAEPVAPATPVNEPSTSYANVSYPTNVADKIVAGSTQLTADDLLPKYDEASDFTKENPVSNLLKEQNFLISGYHMGINTVLQSNKIPYYDLRSAPVIPKQDVGPWSQSSFTETSSSKRRYFEIGAA
jgi:hypothetical protein